MLYYPAPRINLNLKFALFRYRSGIRDNDRSALIREIADFNPRCRDCGCEKSQNCPLKDLSNGVRIISPRLSRRAPMHRVSLIAIRTQQPTKMSATSREIAVAPSSPLDRQTQHFRARIYHVPIHVRTQKSGNRVGNSICTTRYSPICRIAFVKGTGGKKIIPSISRVIAFSFRTNSFVSCPKAMGTRIE